MPARITQEQRRHARLPMVRPCKVRDRRTLVYSAGQTSDISVGGALIRVDRARPFGAGDEIDLVVGWSPGVVLSADSVVRGTVRRVTPIDFNHQAIAIEFAEPSTRALAA